MHKIPYIFVFLESRHNFPDTEYKIVTIKQVETVREIENCREDWMSVCWAHVYACQMP